MAEGDYFSFFPLNFQTERLHCITEFVNVISSLVRVASSGCEERSPPLSESSTGYWFIDLRLKRASLLTRCRSGQEVEVVLVERKLIFGKEEEELFHDQTSPAGVYCTHWTGLGGDRCVVGK